MLLHAVLRQWLQVSGLESFVIEELYKHWSCLGSEGQFTGSHIDHSFLASDVR